MNCCFFSFFFPFSSSQFSTLSVQNTLCHTVCSAGEKNIYEFFKIKIFLQFHFRANKSLYLFKNGSFKERIDSISKNIKFAHICKFFWCEIKLDVVANSFDLDPFHFTKRDIHWFKYTSTHTRAHTYTHFIYTFNFRTKFQTHFPLMNFKWELCVDRCLTWHVSNVPFDIVEPFSQFTSLSKINIYNEAYVFLGMAWWFQHK